MDSLLPLKNLFFLTLALVSPLAVHAFLHVGDRRLWGRIGLALFLVMTSSAHFLSTERMTLMLPEWVPQRVLLIHLTGVLELALAATLWVPGWTKFAGVAIACMLVIFLPANAYAAWNSLPFGGNALGPAYLLLRVSYQIFVVLWTLWATNLLSHSRT